MSSDDDKTNRLRALAHEGLVELQAYITGRVPAWDFVYTKMEAYKFALAPPKPTSGLASLQDRLAAAMPYVADLKPEQQQVAEQFAKRCKRRNSALLSHLLDGIKQARKNEKLA